MAKVTIVAKTKDSQPVSCTYDMGDTDEDFIRKFSQPVTVSFAKASLRIALQDIIRAGIKAKKSVSLIQKDLDEFKPGVKKRGKSEAEKIAEKMKALPDTERRALLANLTK